MLMCGFFAHLNAYSDKSITLYNSFIEFDYLFCNYFKCSVLSYTVVQCPIAEAGKVVVGVY